ncbi:unnamed protein product [Prorocentrum cordatum]|uniref:Uncharacterized protein n=1 Tax=Prorocentrum cordatum TaxID=2364126 RepID=A0ABN9SMG3_9DINO|nr:unnamed protein product [Polarella glacialis]
MKAFASGFSIVVVAAICACARDALQVLEGENEHDGLWKTVYAVDVGDGTCSIAYDNDGFDHLVGHVVQRNDFSLLTLSLNSPSATALYELERTSANAEHPPYAIHVVASIGLCVAPVAIMFVQVVFIVAVLSSHVTHRKGLQVAAEEDSEVPSAIEANESRSLIQRASAPFRSVTTCKVTAKLASSGVVVLYIGRFWMKALLTYSIIFTHHVPIEVSGGLYAGVGKETGLVSGNCLYGSSVGFFLDWMIDVTTPFVNMYVVSHLDSAIDIVLNSLAMEFVANLDNDYKSTVMHGFRAYSRYLLDSEIAVACTNDHARCVHPDAMVFQVLCLGPLIGLIVAGCLLMAKK